MRASGRGEAAWACRESSSSLGLPGAQLDVLADAWRSFLVRRHMGFKLFYDGGIHILCTGSWVLSYFMVVELIFCVQARGFEAIL